VDHPHTDHAAAPAATDRIVSPVAGGLAVASFGLGFFSLCVFWWNPFSTILSSVGLSLGIISLVRGTRGPRGENISLWGTALCATALSITFTLNQVLRFLTWESLPTLF
jgi:hypothetical protein